jgi:hypothetical protein
VQSLPHAATPQPAARAHRQTDATRRSASEPGPRRHQHALTSVHSVSNRNATLLLNRLLEFATSALGAPPPISSLSFLTDVLHTHSAEEQEREAREHAVEPALASGVHSSAAYSTSDSDSEEFTGDSVDEDDSFLSDEEEFDFYDQLLRYHTPLIGKLHYRELLIVMLPQLDELNGKPIAQLDREHAFDVAQKAFQVGGDFIRVMCE